MLCNLVVLHSDGIHKRVEMRSEDEMGLRLVHGLQAEPHAMRTHASVGVNSLLNGYVAHDEKLGKSVIVSPILGALGVVLRVWASNLTLDILLDAE